MATITYIGDKGNASGVGSNSIAAYNQKANHGIIVLIASLETSGQTVTGVSDTANNSYTKLLANEGYVGQGGWNLNCWYVANCLGNAANVIKVMYSASTVQFSCIAAWDVNAPIGTDTDTTNKSAVTTTAPTTGSLSTAQAVEAVCVLYSSGGGFSTTSAINNSYTLDNGIIGAAGNPVQASAHKLTAAKLASETTTLTTSNVTYSILEVAFNVLAGGVPNSLMLTGCGI